MLEECLLVLQTSSVFIGCHLLAILVFFTMNLPVVQFRFSCYYITVCQVVTVEVVIVINAFLRIVIFAEGNALARDSSWLLSLYFTKRVRLAILVVAIILQIFKVKQADILLTIRTLKLLPYWLGWVMVILNQVCSSRIKRNEQTSLLSATFEFSKGRNWDENGSLFIVAAHHYGIPSRSA